MDIIDNVLDSAFYFIPGSGLAASVLRFYALFWVSLYHEIKSDDFGFSLKRLVVLAIIYFAFPILLVWNHIGFICDDVLYHDWRSIAVKKPMFIVGNARSGTTWLHRLIVSSMKKKFTTLKTWEIVFAPSVTWKRFFLVLFKWDNFFLNSFLYRSLCSFEKKILPKSHLHEIGLQLPEEDEWLLAHISLSQLLCFFFPCAGGLLGRIIMFDYVPSSSPKKLPKYHQNLVFKFYKECVQRHLYACHVLEKNDASVVFVSKNPAFTLRLESLYNAFPDCRVICLLRDPRESVPSMVSYIAKVYSTFSTPQIVYPNARALLSYCISHYQYPLEQLNTEKRPKNQWAFVKYSNLKKDLQATLIELFQRLEIKGDDFTDLSSVKVLLKKEQEQTNKFQSLHVHSVEMCCGMDESELTEILRVVYEAHNF